MNIMKVMDIYNRRIANPNFHVTPTTFIFSGKAASSYTFAKETIRLINSVADVINNDPRVNEVMKVCFIPNFRVSNAQLIYPAAEISEQISTAGKEASGTSNMKLMMNGAITLGTLDGANIEIADLAGRENEAIFGLTAPEVEQLWASNSYFAWDTLNNDRERLGRVMDELKDNTFAGTARRCSTPPPPAGSRATAPFASTATRSGTRKGARAPLCQHGITRRARPSAAPVANGFKNIDDRRRNR